MEVDQKEVPAQIRDSTPDKLQASLSVRNTLFAFSLSEEPVPLQDMKGKKKRGEEEGRGVEKRTRKLTHVYPNFHSPAFCVSFNRM